MADILFWLIELILKIVFRQSRNAAKTTQPANQRPRGSLPTTFTSQEVRNSYPQTGGASKAESLQGFKPKEMDVWEEYRKKQEALHRAHQARGPK